VNIAFALVFIYILIQLEPDFSIVNIASILPQRRSSWGGVGRFTPIPWSALFCGFSILKKTF
jgi:hypothetical protein